jgi:hypothetical protein
MLHAAKKYLLHAAKKYLLHAAKKYLNFLNVNATRLTNRRKSC